MLYMNIGRDVSANSLNHLEKVSQTKTKVQNYTVIKYSVYTKKKNYDTVTVIYHYRDINVLIPWYMIWIVPPTPEPSVCKHVFYTLSQAVCFSQG